jgi:tetratricopeptide (TPR) repeat protein
MREALRHQQAGRYREAEACYRRVLSEQPENAEAHNDLGCALHALGRGDEAAAAFRRALECNPAFARAHYNFGRILAAQGAPAAAIGPYQEALALQPDFFEAARDLGLACAALDELDRAEQIVAKLTGASTKPYFRPPFGDYDDSVNYDVFARGYRYSIMWSVDSEGLRGRSADEIIQICLSQAHPGAIYILHVGSASQDAAALPRIIDGLRAQGYDFVTISQLAPP